MQGALEGVGWGRAGRGSGGTQADTRMQMEVSDIWKTRVRTTAVDW